MGDASTVRKYLLGGAVTCAIISLLGMCVWASLYSDYKDNKFKKYYPGNYGNLNALVLCLAILPIISLALLLIAFFFSLCDCCGCLKMIFLVLGLFVFLVTFVIEIICCVYGGFDTVEGILKYGIDNKDLDQYVADYHANKGMDATTESVSNLPPPFAYYQKNPLYDISTAYTIPEYLPKGAVGVCYFETIDDAKNFKEKKCLGHWTGARVKDFVKYMKDRSTEEADKAKKDGWISYQKYRFGNYRDQVLYSAQQFPILGVGSFDMYPSLYMICALMIGINCVAVVFFVLASFMGCCCKSSKVE